MRLPSRRTVTISLVREIVIVISDLYLADGDAGRSSIAAAPPLSGLEDVVRFGQRSALQGAGDRSWRSWLASLAGRDDLAAAAPAAVAAAAATSVGELAAGTAWMVTPVHLIAGLTSLHFDPRSLLTLAAQDLEELARDFTATFGDSGFNLVPTAAGALLLVNPDPIQVATTEPSRALARGVEASLPSGSGAPLIRRLGAEIEMWLHNHHINDARARRGELPVSTLWLWGGGPLLTAASQEPVTSMVAFGTDPYLVGLSRLLSIPLQPLPEQLPNLAEHPESQRLILVTELTTWLQAHRNASLFEALADIDRRFIAPAMTALRRRAIADLRVVANDTVLRVRRRDLFKLWRPRCGSGAAALRGLSA